MTPSKSSASVSSAPRGSVGPFRSRPTDGSVPTLDSEEPLVLGLLEPEPPEVVASAVAGDCDGSSPGSMSVLSIVIGVLLGIVGVALALFVAVIGFVIWIFMLILSAVAGA